jgi:hypothetical protein
LQLQTGENRSKNTPSLLSGSLQNSRKRIMFLSPFVLFNSAASFTKQDFESMDSTLFFLATTCIFVGIRTQTYRNPTSFHFASSLLCYYDKVGKIFKGNLLQRLLEYEYFAN